MTLLRCMGHMGGTCTANGVHARILGFDDVVSAYSSAVPTILEAHLFVNFIMVIN